MQNSMTSPKVAPPTLQRFATRFVMRGKMHQINASHDELEHAIFLAEEFFCGRTYACVAESTRAVSLKKFSSYPRGRG